MPHQPFRGQFGSSDGRVRRPTRLPASLAARRRDRVYVLVCSRVLEGDGPGRHALRVPDAGYYTLYARFAGGAGRGGTVRVGVATGDGVRAGKVDRAGVGSGWVRVGSYRLDEGRREVTLSGAASGGAELMASEDVLVGADARMVSAGDPDLLSGPDAGDDAGSSGGTAATGDDVVAVARAHLGKGYDR